MDFEFVLSGFSGGPFFNAPVGLFGYALLTAYALVVLLALVRQRQSFGLLSGRGWLAFVALLALGALLAQVLILRFPGNLLPPPGIPSESQRPGLALFAFVPAFLAGGWLGVGPAILIGLMTGLSRAAWETHSFATPLEYAWLAGAVAWCVRQDYRGWPAAVLRRPFLAAALNAALLCLSFFLSYYAYSATPGLNGWDYVTSLVLAAAPVFVAQAALAGLLAEAAQLGKPEWWPYLRGSAPPPYLSSLNRKLLFTLIPLFLGGILLLFVANLNIVTDLSTQLAVNQMIFSARNASAGVPFFINTGRSLIQSLATEPGLLTDSPLSQTAQLSQSLRAAPFFRQLTLVRLSDDRVRVLATYPPLEEGSALEPFTETEEQLVALALSGVQQDATLYPKRVGEPVDVLFVAPVFDPAGRENVAALMGYADLSTNPFMQSVTNNLEGLADGQGDGFITDERGAIIYHRDPNQLLQSFTPEVSARPLRADLGNARAYEDRAFDGTRQLVLFYPIEGHAWNLVLVVPNRWVLGLATDIARPIVVILLLSGFAGLLIVSLIANRVTRPAEALALAAQRISEGRLDEPVLVEGEDEVGRAGRAFERMRQKLRARLEELGLLLNVSQKVAASLNLNEALPPILEGALSATGAAGVRAVLVPAESQAAFDPSGLVYQSYHAGPASALMAPLDRGVAELTRKEGRAILENLVRARAVLDVTPVAGKLHALLALPLRQESIYYGALWLGYDQPHTFTETEVNFLTTLAGQAAVAVANARLFESAEQGRQRLAAILASTTDAVIVTDPGGRVLLLNPAAEQAFELTGKAAAGQPLSGVLPTELVSLFKEGPTSANTGELEIASGQTLYASVAPIISADHSILGRVGVLRDVTHFKEVDLMKSEFVATVSHDLRAPLTFMRGYATMLPMVGPLNDKQREFAEKIITGIEQMTRLIDDLLDLGRIEAGVGLAREACRLDEIVHGVVDSLRPQAVNKGLTLTVDASTQLPSVSGDPTLLRQAVSNLVDNAIKYTPAGGQVGVRILAESSKFLLAVSDSGLGIAPADQARLFEKFFRVKQRGSSQIKGSGLGLAIVKSIVERHGGKVWVDSKLGKGSTFFMEIPRNGAG